MQAFVEPPPTYREQGVIASEPTSDGPKADTVAAYRTAAVIFLIAGLPAVATYLGKQKMVTAVVQLAVTLVFAYALFHVRRSWATFLVVVLAGAATLSTVLNIRDGLSLKHTLVIVSVWAFTASMFLLLRGNATRRRTLLAVIVWALVAAPTSIWARLLP